MSTPPGFPYADVYHDPQLDIIAQLRAEVERLKAVQGDWQPVTPDSPPAYTCVLVSGCKHMTTMVVALRNIHGEWLTEGSVHMENIYPPKWWRTLPVGPEED